MGQQVVQHTRNVPGERNYILRNKRRCDRMREFLVVSGTAMDMISKMDSSPQELETLEKTPDTHYRDHGEWVNRYKTMGIPKSKE